MASSVPKLLTSEDFLICNACGTQFPVTQDSGKDECRICDDPRQYVPPEGQTFTTLAQLRKDSHKNVWWQDKEESRVWSVRTEPSFAIGQRAELIQTAAGNILWDLITFLDQATIDRIHALGGLHAIVISHPHYYCTWADWSRTFQCPVYIGAADEAWLERPLDSTTHADIRLLRDRYTEILPGSSATAILTGGHFPGSLLLHFADNLFVADTVFAVPSALNPVPGKQGVMSFSFFWSIPNRIPLHPDDILTIWRLVAIFEFVRVFGAFAGQDVRTMPNESQRGTGGVKGRLLESAKISCRAMGWKQHGILSEEVTREDRTDEILC